MLFHQLKAFFNVPYVPLDGLGYNLLAVFKNLSGACCIINIYYQAYKTQKRNWRKHLIYNKWLMDLTAFSAKFPGKNLFHSSLREEYVFAIA